MTFRGAETALKDRLDDLLARGLLVLHQNRVAQVKITESTLSSAPCSNTAVHNRERTAWNGGGGDKGSFCGARGWGVGAWFAALWCRAALRNVAILGVVVRDVNKLISYIRHVS